MFIYWIIVIVIIYFFTSHSLHKPELFEPLVDSLHRFLKSPQYRLHLAALISIPYLIEYIQRPEIYDVSSPSPIFYLKSLASPIFNIHEERLSDSKEKVREAARRAFTALYGAAHAHRLQDAGAHLFEKIEKEAKSCFSSKLWRAREQMPLWLVDVANSVPSMLLKPYIPLLIQLLKDANEAVRDTTKVAIVNLYNSINNKHAQADIKKTMIKMEIRPAVVEAITEQFNEKSEMKEESDSIPPTPRSEGTCFSSSILSTPTTPPRPAVSVVNVGTAAGTPPSIKMNDQKELEHELNALAACFRGKETEENWESRDKALQRLRGICRGGDEIMEGFPNLFKTTLLEPLCQTVS